MNSELNILGLTGVSKTLLATLYLRSQETQRKNGIIKDDRAVEIVNKINYDFAEYDSEFSQAAIAIRTRIIDRVVSNFISQYPDATIINLGAGLCTRYFRIDNNSINYYCVDLPRVQPVWDNLIGESERLHYLAYSALDFNWMREVKATASGKILIVAEGLLMYFTEVEVKQLFEAISDNFGLNIHNGLASQRAGSQIVFDSIGVFLAQKSRINSGDLNIDATYQWGIKNLREIETWSKNIKLIKQWHYLNQHKHRLGLMGWLSYIPAVGRQVKIGHLQIN